MSSPVAVAVAAAAVAAIVFVCCASPRKEKFQMWTQYRPACSGPWLPDRARCKGITTGAMPLIDNDFALSWRPCCGCTDVPPPVGC